METPPTGDNTDELRDPGLIQTSSSGVKVRAFHFRILFTKHELHKGQALALPQHWPNAVVRFTVAVFCLCTSWQTTLGARLFTHLENEMRKKIF